MFVMMEIVYHLLDPLELDIGSGTYCLYTRPAEVVWRTLFLLPFSVVSGEELRIPPSPPVLKIFSATFSPREAFEKRLREGASAKRLFVCGERPLFPPVPPARFMRNVRLAMGLIIRVLRRG